VRALGRVGDGELRRELARADVLAAPSLGGESFGVVLLEAMAAGLAVVASDVAGYRAVLPAAAGRLVPPGDPAALAEALSELLADGALRARLGEAGRRLSAEYAWPRIAERTLAVYRRVLAGPVDH
jgi:phosphatidyl-myo-inositol alpha-mannosyltransferase